MGTDPSAPDGPSSSAADDQSARDGLTSAPASEARRGWNSDFVQFETTPRSRILERLRLAYPESSREERLSWGDTVPKLQQEIGEVVRKHSLARSRSEPEHFIEFAERRRGWSVIVGLVGSGQEIHIGEEGGLGLWADAIHGSREPHRWTVHAPPEMAGRFRGLTVETSSALTLDETLRSHRATRLHVFVAKLLRKTPPDAAVLRPLADELQRDGHDLRITRDRALAERYLRERYRDHAEARFGLMASSRDRDLVRFDVPNDFQSTKRVRHGPWYNDGEADIGNRSCRYLRDCVTEFGAQGLELDAVLLAWGTDFVLRDGAWVIDRARRYRSAGNATVRDPWQLRANAYRVLLTRGRDAHLVFLPPLTELDETWSYLCSCGFRLLKDR